jgi:hypothetical protein
LTNCGLFVLDAEGPRAWIRYYIKAGLVDRDPILNALNVCRCPFSFSDVRHDLRFPSVDREMLRAAAEHGWARGLNPICLREQLWVVPSFLW